MIYRLCPTCCAITTQRRGICPDCQRIRNAQPHRQAHRTSEHRALAATVHARDGHQCVDCGTSEDLTLDYLVPLQDGGTMTADNAATRCRSCNARRGRRGDGTATRDEKNLPLSSNRLHRHAGPLVA